MTVYEGLPNQRCPVKTSCGYYSFQTNRTSETGPPLQERVSRDGRCPSCAWKEQL